MEKYKKLSIVIDKIQHEKLVQGDFSERLRLMKQRERLIDGITKKKSDEKAGRIQQQNVTEPAKGGDRASEAAHTKQGDTLRRKNKHAQRITRRSRAYAVGNEEHAKANHGEVA